VSGRHAGTRSVRRRFPVVLSVATLVGVWLGVDAPDISPVAPPAVQEATGTSTGAAAASTAPADTAPATTAPADTAPTDPATVDPVPVVPQRGAPAGPGGGR
jgi:hypothetical protein